MSIPVEMTRAEIGAHALAIAAAKTEGAFVLAFAAYVRDVVERETDPYTKIGLFVHAMVEGQRVMFTELLRCNAGGAA